MISVVRGNRQSFLQAPQHLYGRLLGYVQSDLQGQDSAGFARRLSYWNPQGGQDISISVRMGGIYVYRED